MVLFDDIQPWHSTFLNCLPNFVWEFLSQMCSSEKKIIRFYFTTSLHLVFLLIVSVTKMISEFSLVVLLLLFNPQERNYKCQSLTTMNTQTRDNDQKRYSKNTIRERSTRHLVFNQGQSPRIVSCKLVLSSEHQAKEFWKATGNLFYFHRLCYFRKSFVLKIWKMPTWYQPR